MSLVAGTRLGSYEVLSSLGAGGMGEVYRAKDSKLKREVALKVLPADVANDRERLARFQREAEVLASLNHPNIAHIHGLEESGSTIALVMELVEGEDLSQRIARLRASGASARQAGIPIDEALPIAKQIAEALEAAHEQGIIHRDLKPANVKVRPDGTVKVLDFGLAKALEPGAGSREPGAALANSPTITSPAMTMRGVILGTAAYMSPEQARGRLVDRRADIWSFGVVLYEMLSGRRAFDGDDMSITLAGVLKEDVKWDALPSALPAGVVRLLRRCLEKDPKRRLRDIGEARVILDDPAAMDPLVGPSSSPAPSSLRKTWLPWTAAALFLVTTIGAWSSQYRRAPASPPAVVRTTLAPPRGLNRAASLAVSPDGAHLAFVGARNQLYLHVFETAETRVLTGAESGTAPFWSPDSRTVGYFSAGAIKKVDISGGAVQTVCAADPSTGSWNATGTIVFSSLKSGELYRVSANGGTPVSVKAPDRSRGEVAFSAPHFLPDGVHFLYSAHADSPNWEGTYVGSLESATVTRVLTSNGKAQFSPPNLLVFVRDLELFAQSFDPQTWRLDGEPARIAETVFHHPDPFSGRVGFSVSENGVLAVVADDTTSVDALDLAWYSRTGQPLAEVGRANYRGFDLSPDGKSLATHRHVENQGGDLWITDLERGADRRFTFNADEEASSPIWSPDGTMIAFAAMRKGQWGLYRKPANGAGGDELLFQSESLKIPMTWAPDGQSLVFVDHGRARIRSDLWILPLLGDRKPTAYLQTGESGYLPQISPDGRWIAYGADGATWVQSYPTPGTKYQLPVQNAGRVRWRADGKEVFLAQGSRGTNAALVSLAVESSGNALRFGPPTPLPVPGFAIVPHATGIQDFPFDVSADGQRFLLPRLPVSAGATENLTPLTIVVNWPGLLRKQP